MVSTEAFIQRTRERVVNNEFEKIELSKADLSRAVIKLYSHIPFAVVKPADRNQEFELLKYIDANSIEYLKISSVWKDMREKDYKSQKANRDTLYMLVYFKTTKNQVMLSSLSELIDKGIIGKTVMAIYRPKENSDEPDTSCYFEIYKKEGSELNEQNILESAYTQPFVGDGALKDVLNHYIAFSSNEKIENFNIESDNVEAGYYFYIRTFAGWVGFVPQRMMQIVTNKQRQAQIDKALEECF